MNFNSGVSVVIVTLNGKQRLLPTLEHLANQEDINFDWEVLLIDNNSTDGTSGFVQDYWNKEGRPCPLRVFQEMKSGTLQARNAGFDMANYRYILFCDDDNSLSSKYVKTAYDYICEDATIAALGGIGIPKFELEITPPDWVNKQIQFLGCGPQGQQTGDTTFYKGCLYTAGAIIDRLWIQRLYASGFEPKLNGRDGKSLVAGEDTELTYALKAIGGKLHYCEDMTFQHVVPANRLTLDYFKRLYKAMGFSDFILEYYYAPRKSLMFTWLLSTLLIVKYAIQKAIRSHEPSKQTILYYYRHLGRWQANLKLIRTHNKYPMVNLKSTGYHSMS
jgi:glycosyltransferase involved in cell wall biosynthesis